ncbi:MAG: hypothetical protein ABIW49_09390 [Knoellia sp.]
MRAIRLVVAAVVLAGLTTMGAASAQADASASKTVIRYDSWQW